MRESMTYLFAHFVWATWDRLPLLVGERKAHAYRCIETECKRLKINIIAICGMDDHVHLLVDYPPTINVADIAKYVKGASSFVTQCNNADFFKWQGAYAAFAVSRRELSIVRNYIENQEQHHRHGTTLREYEIIGVHEGGQLYSLARGFNRQGKFGRLSCIMHIFDSPNVQESTPMPENEIPLRFEVSLNGEHLATGGAEYGLTFIAINHQRRHPEKDENPLYASSPNFDREEWLKETIDLHFSASDSQSGNSLTWLERTLAIGDHIAIRLQGPGPIDPAVEIRPRRTLREPCEPADAALLVETQEVYEAAIDELLENMDMDDAALVAQVAKITKAVNEYSTAAASVTEESVGNHWKVYHVAAKDMPQRASNIVSGVMRHRMRKPKRQHANLGQEYGQRKP